MRIADLSTEVSKCGLNRQVQRGRWWTAGSQVVGEPGWGVILWDELKGERLGFHGGASESFPERWWFLVKPRCGVYPSWQSCWEIWVWETDQNWKARWPISKPCNFVTLLKLSKPLFTTLVPSVKDSKSAGLSWGSMKPLYGTLQAGISFNKTFFFFSRHRNKEVCWNSCREDHQKGAQISHPGLKDGELPQIQHLGWQLCSWVSIPLGGPRREETLGSGTTSGTSSKSHPSSNTQPTSPSSTADGRGTSEVSSKNQP